MSLSKEFDNMLKRAQGMKKSTTKTTTQAASTKSTTSDTKSKISGGECHEGGSLFGKRMLKVLFILGVTVFVIMFIFRYSCRKFVSVRRGFSSLLSFVTGKKVDNCEDGNCEVLIEDVTEETKPSIQKIPKKQSRVETNKNVVEEEIIGGGASDGDDPLFTKIQDASM